MPQRGLKYMRRIKAAEQQAVVAAEFARCMAEAQAAPPGDPLRKGSVLARIAKVVGVGKPRVCRILQALELEWRERATDDIAAVKAASRATLDRAQREAWSAWERSKQPAQHVQKRPDGTLIQDVSTQGTVDDKPGMPGDPRHLETVLKTDQSIRKLYGVDAPEKTALTDPTGTKPYEQPLTDEERAVRLSQILDRIRERKGEAG